MKYYLTLQFSDETAVFRKLFENVTLSNFIIICKTTNELTFNQSCKCLTTLWVCVWVCMCVCAQADAALNINNYKLNVQT